MFIKNWFYLRKDAPGLKRETIDNPSDTYVNILDVNSPNSGNIISAEDFLSETQELLVSGTNIKTINGESILGSGDITIGSSSPFNAFQYDIKTVFSTDPPLEGQCLIYASEGEIIGVFMHKTTADSLFIGNYLTSRLANSSILINVPDLQNGIIILTTFTDFGSYVRFGAEPGGLGYEWAFGAAGVGTITFIP